MRNLACSAKRDGGLPRRRMAWFSLGATDADGFDGELTDSMVMSLMTRPDRRIVIAVTSNMAARERVRAGTGESRRMRRGTDAMIARSADSGGFGSEHREIGFGVTGRWQFQRRSRQ